MVVSPDIAAAVFGGLIILDRRKRNRSNLSGPNNT
jgi:hypothetical protein